MSEREITSTDLHLLADAGIYLAPHALAGPVLVFPIVDSEGEQIRILWQGGAYESATYLDDRRNQLVFPYLSLYDFIFEAPRPIRRVLMLGAGGCSYPRYLIAKHPGVICDAVEIDPVIAQIAREWFFVDETIEQSSGRLRLHVAEGQDFLQKAQTDKAPHYDAILNDCFSGSIAPEDMASKAWMTLVAERISSGGMYLINVVSAREGVDAAPLHDLLAIGRAVFAHAYAIPADPDSDLFEPDNIMIVCQKD